MAVEIGRATGGAYDVTAGALSAAWGFTRGPKRVPDPRGPGRGPRPDRVPLADARPRNRRTVAFDREGVVINLGSIGKGFAIDRAAEVIRAHWWPTSALIHGGRSSLYALGSPPDDFGGRWPVALRDPFDPEISLGTIHLRNRGMGTSGSAFQQFEVRRPDLRPHPRPPDRRAPLGRPGQRDGPGPDRRRGRRPLDRLLPPRPRGSAPILAGRPEVGALFVTRPDPGSPPPGRGLST